MKFIVIAFALLTVGVSAKPQDDSAVDEGAKSQIEDVIDLIRNRLHEIVFTNTGLDPLEVHNYSSEIVSRLGSSRAWIKDLRVHGFSNIMVESLNFDMTTSKLRIAFVLPRISFNAESMGVELDFLGHTFSAELGGSLDILAVRIVANIRLDVSLNNGVSARNSDVEFSLHSVKSNLRVFLQGRDLSDRVNKALGVTVPSKLRAKKSIINDLLSAATHKVLNHVL